MTLLKEISSIIRARPDPDLAAQSILSLVEERGYRLEALEKEWRGPTTFLKNCKALWPSIRPGVFDTLFLLLTREAVSIDAIRLATSRRGDMSENTPRVYVWRIRKEMNIPVENIYGRGYAIKPEIRKYWKDRLTAKETINDQK